MTGTIIKSLCGALISLLLYSNLYAAQSLITAAAGSACLEANMQRQQAEEAGLDNARTKAIENALEYIGEGNKDSSSAASLLAAYKNAKVRVIRKLEAKWEKNISQECFTITIQAEIVPEAALTGTATRGIKIVDSSASPLNVRIWTDKREYTQGEKIRVYLKGNKAFYARVVYKDAGGTVVQLLPNPFRRDNRFDAGTYFLPADNDRFELEVSPPFGAEEIVAYASTSPLGEIEVAPAGGLYEVKLAYAEIGIKTRGIGGVKTLASRHESNKSSAAEFSEAVITINTLKY